MTILANILLNCDHVDHLFFDFDGVIKDSVKIKSNCFKNLFPGASPNILNKIQDHHLKNGGMSRHEKIPIYMNFAGIELSSSKINSYLHEFSTQSINSVVRSPWVAGILETLEILNNKMTLSIVTATTRPDMIKILKKLDIYCYFNLISGSESSKSEAIRNQMSMLSLDPSQCIFIGDSIHDARAASTNNVTFFLRRTDYNQSLELMTPSPAYIFRDFLNG